jgi:hypothetical protein
MPAMIGVRDVMPAMIGVRNAMPVIIVRDSLLAPDVLPAASHPTVPMGAATDGAASAHLRTSHDFGQSFHRRSILTSGRQPADSHQHATA